MADEKTQTRKPRQSRKQKAATAKTDTAAQVATTASQPSNEQSQVTGHYQAVLPPTNNPVPLEVPNEPRALDIMLNFASQSSGEENKEPFLIHVKSKDKQRGFWRCALFFGSEGCALVVVPDEGDGEPCTTEDGVIVPSITLEQYQRLVDEPRLIVEEL
mgnify:CR=1 FL=1